jgi:hypothetical protein
VPVVWTTARIPGDIESSSPSRVDLIFADDSGGSESAKSKHEEEKAKAFQIKLATSTEISNALKKSLEENNAKELKRIRNAMERDAAIHRSKLHTTMHEVARQLEKYSKKMKLS